MRTNTEQRRKRQKRRRTTSIIILFILIITAAILIFGRDIYDSLTESKETQTLASYYNISDARTQAAVITDGYLADYKGVIRDSECYIAAPDVIAEINDKFYASVAENSLLMTTATDMAFAVGGQPGYSDHFEHNFAYGSDPAGASIPAKYISTDYIPFIAAEEIPLIHIEYVKTFTNLSYALHGTGTDTDPYRLVLTTAGSANESGEIKSDEVEMRPGADKFKPIAHTFSKGDKVTVLDTAGLWSYVASGDGICGYIKSNAIKSLKENPVPAPANYEEPEYTTLRSEEKIVAAWHQLGSSAANDGLAELISGADTLNVIAPTWLKVTGEGGDIASLASKLYVEYAHSQGLKVWALVDDFTHDFDRTKYFATGEARMNTIRMLIDEAKKYGFDGINLDFELTPSEAGADYTQFLREFSLACRLNGLVSSACNYAPTGATEHYNRPLQAKILDYVILMAYDEHWAGGGVAGSVATHPFVKKSIDATLYVGVPADLIIVGVPHYTRIWRTAEDGTVTSDAVGENYQNTWIANKGLTPEWDAGLGQDYVAYEEGTSKYEIWLENKASMQTRLDLIRTYETAGTAAWRLGLEKKEIWQLF
jgi:spore germination protein YaaH